MIQVTTYLHSFFLQPQTYPFPGGVPLGDLGDQGAWPLVRAAGLSSSVTGRMTGTWPQPLRATRPARARGKAPAPLVELVTPSLLLLVTLDGIMTTESQFHQYTGATPRRGIFLSKSRSNSTFLQFCPLLAKQNIGTAQVDLQQYFILKVQVSAPQVSLLLKIFTWLIGKKLYSRKTLPVGFRVVTKCCYD